MGILTRLREAFSTGSGGWWQQFTVIFDDDGFIVKEHTRRSGEIKHSAQWPAISAVCFQDDGLGSDEFRIYTDSQDPILVPVEAHGGNNFWKELVKRDLFPEELSAKAVRSTSSGNVFWWPPSAAR